MDGESHWIDGDLLRCSFCRRSQVQRRRLIAGRSRMPSRKLAGDLVLICDHCVYQAGSRPAVADPGRACSFCGKAGAAAGRMVAEGATAICDECLELCVEIIDEELAG